MNTPLESLKQWLVQFGDPVVQQNGCSFRIVVKLRETLPSDNLSVTTKVSEYFSSLGILHRIGCNRNNLFVEWEIRK